MRFLAALSFALLLAAPLATAQAGAASPSDVPVTRLGQSEQTRHNTAGYYYHHLPGEATIQVQVQGTVLYPGLYEIAAGTDLRRLLALAGGPRYDVRDRTSDRRVEVRLLRPNIGQVYGATLADAAVNPALIPPLRHDDALLIDVVERRRFGWQDAATLVGAVGTLGFLIQALAN